MSPRDRVLLVEGRDDRKVIYQFCNHYQIDNKNLFSVEAKDGIENLLDDLRIRVRTGVKVLAAVIDADVVLTSDGIKSARPWQILVTFCQLHQLEKAPFLKHPTLGDRSLVFGSCQTIKFQVC